MWCPVCKNEYREGFYHCPDCDVDLVESLDDIPKEESQYEGPSPEELAFMLAEAAGLDEQESETLSVQELLDAASELESMDDDDVPGLPRVYESKRQKAEDNRSSGFALLTVGILGIVTVILLFLDKLPIRLTGSSRYLICSVMGIMFVIFVVMGFMAFAAQKKLMTLADEEEQLIENAKRFLEDELSADYIDRHSGGIANDDEDDQEDMQAGIYFRRMEVIRGRLSEGFPDMDRALCEKLCDEYYSGLYGE